MSTCCDSGDFATAGAIRFFAVLPAEERDSLTMIADALPAGRPGMRLSGDPALARILEPTGCVGTLASDALGQAAHPVRALLFNKTTEANWIVPWHQDRTIAVRDRQDVVGFGPWSVKGGMHHVEPPFEILAGMVTVRIHLDDCGADNAPLLVAPGSHRLGRVPAKEAAGHAARIGQVACLAEAGDVWLYATPILHASERAGRPAQRRVVQVDYATTSLPSELEWLGLTQQA
jgi:ectoine hydroxylase-related dioxygenase (phytanoyl-CoA dioxygenase family)